MQDIQPLLLDAVKTKTNPHLSYVEELASLLDISRDSVYRRIRGETELTISETLKICEHYHISLHELNQEKSNLFSFSFQMMDREHYTLYDWLKSVLGHLEFIHNYTGESELIYYTKDLPVFYYFNYPNLARFKFYFWMKTILHYPEYERSKYNFELVSKELIQTGTRIWEKYCSVPSTEIWGEETITVTFKQIEYYMECGYFEDRADAMIIMDEFEQLIKDSRDYMIAGKKPHAGAALQIYKNDILIGDNSILFKLDDKRLAFLPLGNLSILRTTNEVFNEHLDTLFTNIIKRSIRISTTGEKERNKYFNKIMDNYAVVRKRMFPEENVSYIRPS